MKLAVAEQSALSTRCAALAILAGLLGKPEAAMATARLCLVGVDGSSPVMLRAFGYMAGDFASCLAVHLCVCVCGMPCSRAGAIAFRRPH